MTLAFRSASAISFAVGLAGRLRFTRPLLSSSAVRSTRAVDARRRRSCRGGPSGGGGTARRGCGRRHCCCRQLGRSRLCGLGLGGFGRPAPARSGALAAGCLPPLAAARGAAAGGDGIVAGSSRRTMRRALVATFTCAMPSATPRPHCTSKAKPSTSKRTLPLPGEAFTAVSIRAACIFV